MRAAIRVGDWKLMTGPVGKTTMWRFIFDEHLNKIFSTLFSSFVSAVQLCVKVLEFYIIKTVFFSVLFWNLHRCKFSIFILILNRHYLMVWQEILSPHPTNCVQISSADSALFWIILHIQSTLTSYYEDRFIKSRVSQGNLKERSWPIFIKPVSTKMCLAWNFFLDKNRITNQISTWFSGKASNNWIPVTSNMQQTEIWLVILFLSRKKFHAAQICVLTGFMKFCPGS